MKLSNAVEGFVFALKAEGYAASTIKMYIYVFDVLRGFLGDVEVEAIKPADLTRYFAYLRTSYTPNRMNGDLSPLSGGSLQNHWKAIRRFFRWAVSELRLRRRPDADLKLPPNKNPKVVLPLSEEEVKALMKVAEYCKPAETHGRKSFVMRKRTGDRDVALLFALLDTGLRVEEMGRLNIQDVNFETGEVFVAPFGNSGYKNKSRTVFFGKVTLRAVWRYLTTREDRQPTDPLFLSTMGYRMDNNSIRLLLADLGRRSGVKNVHPHRFRHTFAIEFLRNGGDVFSLQRLLGHSTLAMVEKYLSLSTTDMQNAHRKASPADKWRLQVR